MRRLMVAAVALLAGCSQGVMPEGFKYGEIGTRQEDFLSGLLKDERLKGIKVWATLNTGGELVELDRDPTSAKGQLNRLLRSAPGDAFLRVGANEVASFKQFEFELADGAVTSATFDVDQPTSQLFEQLVAAASKRTGVSPKRTSRQTAGKVEEARFVNCDTLVFYELRHQAMPSPLNPDITWLSLRLTIFKLKKDTDLWRTNCATGPRL